MRWPQGSQAVFTADFAAYGGGFVALVAPPTAIILDPGGVQVTTGMAIKTIDGNYSYIWNVPLTATAGTWKVKWSASTTDPVPVVLLGEEMFDVVAAGTAVPSEGMVRLRNLVDRKLPDMLDSDLFFPEEDIHTLYVKNGRDVFLAAYEGWLIKAGVYSELVDVVESRAGRKLSQRYKNAMSQVEFFRKRVEEERDLENKSTSRVPGKAFTLRGQYVDVFGIATVATFSPYWQFAGSSGYMNYFMRTYSLRGIGSGTLVGW